MPFNSDVFQEKAEIHFGRDRFVFGSHSNTLKLFADKIRQIFICIPPRERLFQPLTDREEQRRHRRLTFILTRPWSHPWIAKGPFDCHCTKNSPQR